MASRTKAKRRATTAPPVVPSPRAARHLKAGRERDNAGIRFDFDFHGLRSASVAVQERCTEDAGDLIAAAIHQAWLQPADDET